MVRPTRAVTTATITAARAAWTGLGVHPLELRLDNTLENGQCFGWRRQPGDEPVWVGVLGEHVLALCQTEDDCMFRCVGGPAVAARDAAAAAAEEAAIVTQLRDYFQLDQPLRPLYAGWAACCRTSVRCTARQSRRWMRRSVHQPRRRRRPRPNGTTPFPACSASPPRAMPSCAR